MQKGFKQQICGIRLQLGESIRGVVPGSAWFWCLPEMGTLLNVACKRSSMTNCYSQQNKQSIEKDIQIWVMNAKRTEARCLWRFCIASPIIWACCFLLIRSIILAWAELYCLWQNEDCANIAKLQAEISLSRPSKNATQSLLAMRTAQKLVFGKYRSLSQRLKPINQSIRQPSDHVQRKAYLIWLYATIEYCNATASRFSTELCSTSLLRIRERAHILP